MPCFTNSHITDKHPLGAEDERLPRGACPELLDGAPDLLGEASVLNDSE